MTHQFGAHLSISGGYTQALHKIITIGGNCLQIFSSSPRGWNFARVSEDSATEFISLKTKLAIDPIYFHASYLINLADNGRIGQLSKQSLKHELNIASKLGVKGSIVHLGSFKNGDRGLTPLMDSPLTNEFLIKNIQEILSQTPPKTLFIIENAGTRKIGRTLEEISQIIRDVNDERLRVCLDTCHLHAAGYDLSTREKFETFLNLFDSLIGIEKLEIWHINDSRDSFGSLRDRHENLGKGAVGIKVFKLLMNHPLTSQLPFIIETPGFDNTGPDKKNLDILKNLLLTKK